MSYAVLAIVLEFDISGLQAFHGPPPPAAAVVAWIQKREEHNGICVYVGKSVFLLLNLLCSSVTIYDIPA